MNQENAASWDVFVSHASEDKEEVARPLAESLRSMGYRVWLDEDELVIGDSLRERIDEGLHRSRAVVLILSEAFFSKEWPQAELDGLYALAMANRSSIYPVWHGIGVEYLLERSPMLAGLFAARTSDGIENVAEMVSQALRGRETALGGERWPGAEEVFPKQGTFGPNLLSDEVSGEIEGSCSLAASVPPGRTLVVELEAVDYDGEASVPWGYAIPPIRWTTESPRKGLQVFRTFEAGKADLKLRFNLSGRARVRAYWDGADGTLVEKEVEW